MNPPADDTQWRVALPQFNVLRYYVRREDCQVRVLQGCKGDKYETKRRAAIEIDNEELKRLKALLEGRADKASDKKGGAPSDWYYTYIAIFFRVLGLGLVVVLSGSSLGLKVKILLRK